MVHTDDGIIFSGPTDEWPQLEVPLASRLIRSLVDMGDHITLAFPNADESSALEVSARWILERAAADIARLQLRPGDVVAAFSSCSPHMATLMMATLARGAVFAPLNPDQPIEDLRRLLSRLSPTHVLCESSALEAVSAASPVSPQLLGGAAPVSPTEVQRFIEEQMSRPKPTEEEKKQLSIALHSSGTTGDPKTILFSQASIDALIDLHVRKDSNFVHGDTLVLNTPFFWATAVVSLLMCLDIPIKLVAVKGMNPTDLRNAIQKFQATAALSATHVWLSMAKLPDASAEPFRTLRYAVSCGSALDANKTALVEATLGVRMSQWYGTTEILTVAGLTRGKRHPPAGSVGRLSAYVQGKVVDVSTGRPLGVGEDGELCFRGPFSCSAIGPDTWYHTGDIGHYDNDGWIYVVDRVKDLIKFRGIHVSPSEIESVLLSHPAVSDVVVLGQPHLTDTEHPTAFVVLKPRTTTTSQELVDLVADKLAQYPYKHLRGGAHLIPSIPRTVVGKIRRGELLNYLTKQMGHPLK